MFSIAQVPKQQKIAPICTKEDVKTQYNIEIKPTDNNSLS